MPSAPSVFLASALLPLRSTGEAVIGLLPAALRPTLSGAAVEVVPAVAMTQARKRTMPATLA